MFLYLALFVRSFSFLPSISLYNIFFLRLFFSLFSSFFFHFFPFSLSLTLFAIFIPFLHLLLSLSVLLYLFLYLSPVFSIFIPFQTLLLLTLTLFLFICHSFSSLLMFNSSVSLLQKVFEHWHLTVLSGSFGIIIWKKPCFIITLK
jgi:hypothetical protein